MIHMLINPCIFWPMMEWIITDILWSVFVFFRRWCCASRPRISEGEKGVRTCIGCIQVTNVSNDFIVRNFAVQRQRVVCSLYKFTSRYCLLTSHHRTALFNPGSLVAFHSHSSDCLGSARSVESLYKSESLHILNK